MEGSVTISTPMLCRAPSGAARGSQITLGPRTVVAVCRLTKQHIHQPPATWGNKQDGPTHIHGSLLPLQGLVDTTLPQLLLELRAHALPLRPYHCPLAT